MDDKIKINIYSDIFQDTNKDASVLDVKQAFERRKVDYYALTADLDSRRLYMFRKEGITPTDLNAFLTKIDVLDQIIDMFNDDEPASNITSFISTTRSNEHFRAMQLLSGAQNYQSVLLNRYGRELSSEIPEFEILAYCTYIKDKEKEYDVTFDYLSKFSDIGYATQQLVYIEGATGKEFKREKEQLIFSSEPRFQSGLSRIVDSDEGKLTAFYSIVNDYQKVIEGRCIKK